MTLSKADLKADFDSAVLARNAAAKQTNEGQCLRKKPYMTKTAAMTTAEKCWEKRQVRLRAYQCPNCNWWHLTKWEVAQ